VVGLTGLLSLLILAGVAGLAIWAAFLRDIPTLPPRELLLASNRAPAMKFYDRNNTLIASRGPRYGDAVSLKALPAHVPLAFLAAEDRRFFSHGVVDLHGLTRATLANLKAGHVVQGGSTLTQQLAKSLFDHPDQTLKRKVQEAVIARKIAGMMSRQDVLELYLNRIYFGANTFGIDGASRGYFGKPASQLSLSESALLAALPKAPSKLSPIKGMTAVLDRSHLILANMRAEGWITPAQEAAARADIPRLAPEAPLDEGDFSYVLDYAAVEAVRKVGTNSPVLSVYLTIDPVLQLQSAAIVRHAIEQNPGANASQASAIVLAPDGSIRAMIGGVDYDRSPFNRATQSVRQPGSTFKAFVYAAALERGAHPKDIKVDSPTRIGGWSPKNYGGGYSGRITLETALARSVNTVAVKLAREIGAPAVAELASRFGISNLPPEPNLTIALGSYETSLINLTSAFQVFQLGGRRVAPEIIDRVTTVDGHVLYTRPPLQMFQVYDPVRAGQMVRMLMKVVTEGTGQRAAFGPQIAGKTGTSQSWRDAWFVGFTPNFTGGVWIGNDDNSPMNHVTGGTLPTLIWREIMLVAHDGQPVADFEGLPPEPAPNPVNEPAISTTAARPGMQPESAAVPAWIEAPQTNPAPARRPAEAQAPGPASAEPDFGQPYEENSATAPGDYQVIMPGEPGPYEDSPPS
jgi:penicillin-binding protein 1A